MTYREEMEQRLVDQNHAAHVKAQHGKDECVCKWCIEARDKAAGY